MIKISFFFLFFFIACGPSVEDSLEKLAFEPQQADAARNELLLAKDRSVGPLLNALDNPRYGAARAEAAAILVGLMARVEDKRIAPALQHHLLLHPEPAVRGRIAHRLSPYRLEEFADVFFAALDDSAAQVRAPSLRALLHMKSKLDEAQHQRLLAVTSKLATDPDRDVRISAMMVSEEHVRELIEEARERELKADLAGAQESYEQALAYAPTSRRANFFFSRFYFENGQRQRGIEILRNIGMLVEIPSLQTEPQIDGRLDEAVWQRALMVDKFYQWGSHAAYFAAETQTRAYLGYTDEALYLGAVCAEPYPDSLVVNSRNDDDDNHGKNDLIEFFFDTNHDFESCVFININTVGAVADAYLLREWTTADYAWDANGTVAVHIGADFWSVEYKLDLGVPHLPQPQPGDIWGLNIQRGYRGETYGQWARTYGEMYPAASLGFLVFD